MGTRSTISIENEDGTCTGVYCHWDGYLSHHGPILLGAYDTAEKVRALIAPGDMSVLDWSPGEEHDFNNPPEGQCNYYGRDRLTAAEMAAELREAGWSEGSGWRSPRDTLFAWHRYTADAYAAMRAAKGAK
jgi:hypothetical protein